MSAMASGGICRITADGRSQAGPKGSPAWAMAGVTMQATERAARMRGFIGGGSVVGLKGKPSGYAERHQNQGRGDTDH